VHFLNIEKCIYPPLVMAHKCLSKIHKNFPFCLGLTIWFLSCRQVLTSFSSLSLEASRLKFSTQTPHRDAKLSYAVWQAGASFA